MIDVHELVSEHGDDVWKTIYRICPDDDTNDCFQQTFLDAIRLDGDQVGNWKAVLKSIAARRAIDMLRQKYRRRVRNATTSVDLLASRPESDPVATEEFLQIVRQTLAKLPENCAEAFYLRHVEQMTPGEIGTQLGIQTGHVRVLVHRAIKHLRNALDPKIWSLTK